MATSERFGTAPEDEHRRSRLAIAIVRILADRHPNMRVPEDKFVKRSDSLSTINYQLFKQHGILESSIGAC